MSNDEFSSVEWLIDRIKNQHLYPFVPLDELEKQAKAMHKEEVTSFTADWSIQYKYENGKNINQYYNETFGGNNEQE